LLVLPHGYLLAQSTGGAGAASVEEKIAALEQQLAALKAEVAALKAPAPAAVAATPAAATPAAGAAAPANPLAGIASVLGGATLNGLVDGYYNYNFNTPATHTTPLHLFDNAANQFGLNLIEVGLVKTPAADSRLGYNVTLGFGNAMNVVNSSDPAGLGFAQYLKEGYLSYLAPVGKGLQFDFGKFVTPNGAEVIESNQNWNYSRSVLFYYAIPFYHMGLRAKYTFNDKFALTGYVVNGWNNLTEPYGTGKTGGLSLAWTPNKKFSFTETWMGGPGATTADPKTWRNLLDTVAQYNLTSKATLMANVDYGRSERFAGLTKPSEWYGAAGYVKYQFDPKWAVAARYEYYNDPDGVTTGSFLTNGSFDFTRQHIQEVTGTVERKVAQHLITRLEFRHDMANQATFLKNSSPAFGQTTVAAGLMFVLEPNETK
jgi:hypothetical protein